MEREKKRELATYYKLYLDRQLKSRAKRRKVADGGLYVFIGGYAADQPFLKVPKSNYVDTWRRVAAEMSARLAGKISDVGECFNLLLPRIERETYVRLAVLMANLSELDRQFAKRHRRAMTAREKELYVGAAALDEHAPPTVSAQQVRRIWLNSLMGKIQRAQTANLDNLQKAWAEVVGAEAALETVLERVDAAKGVAYCRSLSSARRFALQRRPGLPALLGKQLKLNLRKIVFR
ncbi:MAG: hypothetical protein LBK60_10320 [Verrucomicrobiales bacterium]|nr:hypothetical protein [Verrucomicrobiales bacterium]